MPPIASWPIADSDLTETYAVVTLIAGWCLVLVAVGLGLYVRWQGMDMTEGQLLKAHWPLLLCVLLALSAGVLLIRKGVLSDD